MKNRHRKNVYNLRETISQRHGEVGAKVTVGTAPALVAGGDFFLASMMICSWFQQPREMNLDSREDGVVNSREKIGHMK
jgi:hypothetical protein